MPTDTDPFERIYEHDPIELDRYTTLRTNLGRWRSLFVNGEVLDFGASDGLSIAALLHHGANAVVGIEPDEVRVRRGLKQLAEAGLDDRSQLEHVPDTRHLGFAAGRFQFVLLNAVLEHIPQPRDEYIQEVWRVLCPGGHLMINETPNKYYPKEIHTTGLWFNHWLPSRIAYRRAIRRGRFDERRKDWSSSGWRGVGYLEMTRSLKEYRILPERTRLRHRVLSFLRIPASLFDPYPTWVLKKPAYPGLDEAERG